MNEKEKEEGKELARLMNDYKEILVEEGIGLDLAKDMVRDFHKSVVDSMLAKQQMEEFEKVSSLPYKIILLRIMVWI